MRERMFRGRRTEELVEGSRRRLVKEKDNRSTGPELEMAVEQVVKESRKEKSRLERNIRRNDRLSCSQKKVEKYQKLGKIRWLEK